MATLAFQELTPTRPPEGCSPLYRLISYPASQARPCATTAQATPASLLTRRREAAACVSGCIAPQVAMVYLFNVHHQVR
jgi:hypothetical protein